MDFYYESAKGMTITRARAVAEYAAHGMSEAQLLIDLGDHENYQAQKVLAWLGY